MPVLKAREKLGASVNEMCCILLRAPVTVALQTAITQKKGKNAASGGIGFFGFFGFLGQK